MIPELMAACIGHELPAAREWANRHGLRLGWDELAMTLYMELRQPKTGEVFVLRGTFEGYKSVPPAWTFCDLSRSDCGQPKYFPRPENGPGGVSSIFLPTPVICAPFNLLAYAEHQGPHGDWGGPTKWLSAGQGNIVRATTIADMLQTIRSHFQYTAGRMSP